MHPRSPKLRRYAASLDQLYRMYSHPSDEAPADDQNPETAPVDETALDAELAELEDEIEQS